MHLLFVPVHFTGNNSPYQTEKPGHHGPGFPKQIKPNSTKQHEIHQVVRNGIQKVRGSTARRCGSAAVFLFFYWPSAQDPQLHLIRKGLAISLGPFVLKMYRNCMVGKLGAGLRLKL